MAATRKQADPTEVLTIIRPHEHDRLRRLGGRIARTREFLSDEVLQNPVGWFIAVFASWNSVVYDVADDAGVLAVSHIIPKWRAQVYVAAWEPRALRQHAAWRAGVVGAMQAYDLHRVDAFIAEDNAMSLRLAERMGFTYAGTMRKGACYNGVSKDVLWFEGTREAAGLPPI